MKDTSKTPQEGDSLEKTIFQKYLPQISKIIPGAETLSTAKVKQIGEWWSDGTRSITRIYESRGAYALKRQHYIIQFIPDEHTEDALIKRAINDVFSRHDNLKDLFAKARGYEKAPDGHIFVYDPEWSKTLYGQLEDRNEKIEDASLIHFLDPVIALHSSEKKYVSEIEQRLSELSKDSDVKVSALEKLTSEDYTSKVLNYCGVKNPEFKGLLQEKFNGLFQKYFMNENLQALVQHDGYPWNITGERMIDPGDMKFGPRVMHLGCLLGHPSVFNRIRNRVKGIDRILEYYTNCSGKQKFFEEIRGGFYLASFYANYRLTLGDTFNESIKRKLKRTALRQIRILSKTDRDAEIVHDLIIKDSK